MSAIKHPEILGRYQIIDELPRGLSGPVYHAIHLPTNEEVALKILQNTKPQVRHYFFNEHKLLTRAGQSGGHPHLVRLVHSNVRDEPFSIATAFVAAAPNQELADQRNSALMLHVVEQIGSALDYLHQRHPDHPVIHRDLKPDNILIDRTSGHATLIDLSVALHPYFSLEDDRSFGTFQYMAPEQYTGQETPATDIFALALLAYYFFWGKPLLDRNGLKSARKKIKPKPTTTEQAAFEQALAEWKPAVQQELSAAQATLRQNLERYPATAAVLVQALDFDPAHRPPSCAALAHQLRQAIVADGAPVDTPIVLPEASRRRSSKPATIGIGALATGAIALLIWGGGVSAGTNGATTAVPADVNARPVATSTLPALGSANSVPTTTLGPTVTPAAPTSTLPAGTAAPVVAQGNVVVTASDEVFRLSPGNESRNLLGRKFLRVGEQLTIIDGPVRVQRETWFKARRADGLEGWLRDTAFR